MNNKRKVTKIAKKISLLLAIIIMVFGLWFGTANALVSISTLNPSNVNSTNAVLNGFVGFVSGDNLITTAYFEWGTSTNFTNAVTQSYYSNNIGNYRTTIGGLNPNTLYYFRAVAKNSQGKVYGNILSFITKPSYYNYIGQATSSELRTNTSSATKISSTSAQLNGLITNRGTIPSNTYFEWGTSFNLINKTKVISTGAFPVVRHINKLSGLNPNTSYYFHIVAEDNFSRSVGETIYFTTSVSSGNINNKSTNTKNDATIIPVGQDEQIGNNLSANILSANFLPGSLTDWLLLIIFTLVFILLVQHSFTPAVVKQENTE